MFLELWQNNPNFILGKIRTFLGKIDLEANYKFDLNQNFDLKDSGSVVSRNIFVLFCS